VKNGGVVEVTTPLGSIEAGQAMFYGRNTILQVARRVSTNARYVWRGRTAEFVRDEGIVDHSPTLMPFVD
jgi:hypothetical protein